MTGDLIESTHTQSPPREPVSHVQNISENEILTYDIFANSWKLLKVNSQKSQLRLMFGSDGLETEGSTSPGPGFSKKVNFPSTENQSRAPASCGMVTDVTEPAAPSGIAQSTARAVPVELGEVGK